MNKSPASVALYLRADGSLLLVKAESTVEIVLTPRQLLDLGTDALRVALALDPGLVGAIAEVLDTTYVIPSEGTSCQLN